MATRDRTGGSRTKPGRVEDEKPSQNQAKGESIARSQVQRNFGAKGSLNSDKRTAELFAKGVREIVAFHSEMVRATKSLGLEMEIQGEGIGRDWKAQHKLNAPHDGKSRTSWTESPAVFREDFADLFPRLPNPFNPESDPGVLQEEVDSLEKQTGGLLRYLTIFGSHRIPGHLMMDARNRDEFERLTMRGVELGKTRAIDALPKSLESEFKKTELTELQIDEWGNEGVYPQKLDPVTKKPLPKSNPYKQKLFDLNRAVTRDPTLLKRLKVSPGNRIRQETIDALKYLEAERQAADRFNALLGDSGESIELGANYSYEKWDVAHMELLLQSAARYQSGDHKPMLPNDTSLLSAGGATQLPQHPNVPAPPSSGIEQRAGRPEPQAKLGVSNSQSSQFMPANDDYLATAAIFTPLEG
jgi:hypothetical protein